MWRGVCLVLLSLTACGKGGGVVGPAEVPSTDLRVPPPPEDGEASGVELRLTEARPTAGGEEALARPAATKLSDAETTALLSRLPALPAAERAAFAVRPGSAPPPRKGEVVRTAWPPPPAPPPTVATGPVSVVRSAPQGDVPVAPNVSITFNQPMVPLTSQDEATAMVPVTLSPQPAGQWRWIGTSTLLFEPDVRMPASTAYTVSAPAGTRAATGGVLAEAWTATFRTPTARLMSSAPGGGSVDTSPVIVLGFDQAMDPEVVRSHAVATAGRQAVTLRLASEAEVLADPVARGLWQGLAPERRVALAPTAALPTAADVRIELPAGLASAEGPLRTTAAQAHSFQTYGPLMLGGVSCGWGDGCRPGMPWTLSLSNPIDPDTLSVSISPGVPGVKVSLGGQQVYISGNTRPDTKYTITLDPGLRDVFGQAVSGERSVKVEVGPAEPMSPYIQLLGDELQITDPFAEPAAAFSVAGLSRVRVRVSRVTPADWAAWVRSNDWEVRRKSPDLLVGKILVDEVRPVPTDPAGWSVFDVDLAKWLEGGAGHLLVEVSDPGAKPDRRSRAVVWVQVTRMGLIALADDDELLVWATDLATGAPLGGVSVEHGGGEPLRTDKHGLARLPLPVTSGTDGVPPLVATLAGDVAMLPASTGRWATSSWGGGGGGVHRAWLVFDDRHLYRPGETVHVKGWMRSVDHRPGGDLLPAGDLRGSMRWTARDAQGVEIAKGETALDAWGGFALDLALPGTPNLGTAWIQIEHQDGEALSHAFEIQEFRRPEFEVSAMVETAAPHVIGDEIVAVATASYFAGGPLPQAETSWSASSSPATWQPAGWEEWRFGRWRPWWGWWTDDQPSGYAHLAGTTDAMGAHHVALHVDRVVPAGPTSVSLEATVTDVNRQAWTAKTSVVVHAGRVYVGARPNKAFYDVGEPVLVDVIAVDLDGGPVDAMVDARLVRREWQGFQDGSWREVDAEERVCAVRAPREAASCKFAVDSGSWELRARVADADGRVNETRFPVWVGAGARPVAQGVQMESVQLIPDRDLYSPGDVAKVRVQVPFGPAELLVTTLRGGILSSEQVSIDGSSTVLSVPVGEEHVPNLFVAVEATGVGVRTDAAGAKIPGAPARPAVATGNLNLRVSTASRTLGVAITPAQRELAPGERTEVAVRVTDARGRPVEGASVALVVVDEAVLALTGYEIPDPIAVFYPERATNTAWRHTQTWIRLADLSVEAPQQGELGGRGMATKSAMRGGAMPPPAPMMESMMMADAVAPEEAEGEPGAPIQVRTDFSANAAWLPALTTGPDGVVRQEVKLPDNLTRYRVTAVVVDRGTAAGRNTTDLTARLPLMLRPSAPRFLNFGDHAELPLVLQNQTDQAMVVSVALRADNLKVDGSTRGGRKVTVPARDRVEVRFPVAAEEAGVVRLQAAAASGKYADAAELSLPVWTPATTEAFATYGVLDGPKGTVAMRQPMKVPGEVWPQHGGLEIQTSSTALQELTDAFIYLVDYPYGCVEQLSSRVLSVAALRDVLTAFGAEGLPDGPALDKMVKADVDELVKRQEPDGSWGWWRRGEGRPSPTTTLHATHALVRAHQAGVPLDARALSKALGRIERIEEITPKEWGKESRLALKAQAVAIRRAGKRDVAAMAMSVYREGGGVAGLSLESLGWLMPSLPPAEQAEIRAHLNNRVTESAASARFVTSYGETDDAMILGSSRRTDAVILDALLQVSPDDALLPKVVAGLLDGRAQGRWASTQENAWVLLALQRYFRVSEAVTPDLMARAWLGDGLVGEHRFQGRTTERATTEVPMAWLAEQGDADITLAREGAGRMYYRMGLRYAPRSLELAAAERGFSVTRTWEGVDDPADVRLGDDGVWHVKAGARVRVTLRMVAPDRRYHVALVDPLPAGLGDPEPRAAWARRRCRLPTATSRRGPAGGAGGTITRTCATSAPRPSR
jgi:uncharacterized protein YfaS (alpha-2-macroglobulin family)